MNLRNPAAARFTDDHGFGDFLGFASLAFTHDIHHVYYDRINEGKFR